MMFKQSSKGHSSMNLFLPLGSASSTTGLQWKSSLGNEEQSVLRWISWRRWLRSTKWHPLIRSLNPSNCMKTLKRSTISEPFPGPISMSRIPFLGEAWSNGDKLCIAYTAKIFKIQEYSTASVPHQTSGWFLEQWQSLPSVQRPPDTCSSHTVDVY